MWAEEGEEDLCVPMTVTVPMGSSLPASSVMLLLFSLSQGSARVTPSVQPQPQPVRYAWLSGAQGGVLAVRSLWVLPASHAFGSLRLSS